ncbi:hypothetical protein TNCV_1562911 [Trichonephila clavipes]|nr:hypothetical protein TNCV_1562911 [Trichonephila clavipes]
MIRYLYHLATPAPRKNEGRITKKVFNTQPIDTQRNSRANLKLIDGLVKDILVLRTRNERTPIGRKLAWKRLLKKDKLHPGLSCH